jgi:hypothetical protein
MTRTFRIYLLPLITVVFGVFLGFTVFFCYTESGKHPVIHVDTEEIDFGALSSGTKVTQTVLITNTGQSDLIIKDIISGCGCTEAELKRNEITPGQSEPLYVTMEPSPFGVKTKLLILTNDPKRQRVLLLVKADAVMEAVIDPVVVDFGTIKNPKQLPISQSVNIIMNPDYFADTDLNDIVIEASNPFLQIDASRRLTESTRTITLTLSDNAPVGDIFTELYLKEKTRTTRMRILGYVRGDYLALPQMLILGPVQRQDNPITKTIDITFRNPRHLESVPKLVVESCSLSEPLQGLVTVYIKADDGKVKVFLTMNPSLYKGLWSIRDIYGHLKIRCSSHATPIQYLHIPVMVSLRVPKRK